MIYSFSPNWYKPQCLHFCKEYLYYCSNYLLYRYDLSQKRVDHELCLRQIAIQHQINHKDIKINAISSNQQSLLVAINQPYLVLIDKHTMAFDSLRPLNNFIAQYIHPYQQEDKSRAVLCNKDGTLARFFFQQTSKDLIPIEIKAKSSILKIIYSIQNHHLAIFTRGTILIFNRDFTVLQKVVELSQGHTIFSADHIQKGQEIYFCFLTKLNESHFITIFKLNLHKQFPLEHKKKIEEIADDLKRFEINWHYPNKFTQKLKNNQKASLSIKLLSQKQVIVTGKLGEIVTIMIQKVQEGNYLKIKPYSYEYDNENQQNDQYEVWHSSKHYKEIYWIYRHQNRLYVISTDHNLSIWSIGSTTTDVKFVYSVKFLTAAVQSFFYSEQDPRNVFALLKDSAIRCFTPLDESSHQINQFWKFSKKFTIKKAVCHPSEEGVLALITQCNKIQLYDVYEDRLMKLIHFQEQILNISFQFASIKGEIQKMFGYEFSPIKLQYVSHLTKQVAKDELLMLQTNSSIQLISHIMENQLECCIGKRQKRFERIHENRYWDQKTLLCSVSRKASVDLLIRHVGKQLEVQQQLIYNQGKVMFKMMKNSNQLILFNFKGSKITIKRCLLQRQEKICFTDHTQITLNYSIDYLNLNYKDQRMAIYNQRHDALIIIDAHHLKPGNNPINAQNHYAQLYSLSSKIETFCFYLQHHLIVATKDQSIKILDLHTLQLLKSSVPSIKAETNNSMKGTPLLLSEPLLKKIQKNQNEKVILEKSEPTDKIQIGQP